MPCKRCASDNGKTFSSEVALHFRGIDGLTKPIVWVFPEILVCFDCGSAEFAVPERELRVLNSGLPVNGAVVLPDESGAPK
jgi:hypothetical protein